MAEHLKLQGDPRASQEVADCFGKLSLNKINKMQNGLGDGKMMENKGSCFSP